MAATEDAATEIERGWLSVLFGASQARPAGKWASRRMRPGMRPVEFVVAPEVSAAILEVDLIEDRARAATSGFELGEYEPMARRN